MNGHKWRRNGFRNDVGGMAKLTWAMTMLAAIAVAVIVATFFSYQSLDPCHWLARDMAAAQGLTVPMAEANIRAGFLLEGTVQPDNTDCLLEWWSYRFNSVGGGD
jgi:hypothetical protein